MIQPVKPARPTCDFCTEPSDKLKNYADWKACPVCAVMIDSKRWNALLDYSVASFVVANAKLAAVIPEEDMRAAIRKLLDQFRRTYDHPLHKM